jgi:hypothetical protein
MPLLAGTVLSLAAVAAVASQDPGPAAFPVMSIRHPLASYLALAPAPFGNGLELFALVAFIYAACILIASWRHERRQHRRTAARRRPAQRGGQGQPVTPQPRPGRDRIRCPAAPHRRPVHWKAGAAQGPIRGHALGRARHWRRPRGSITG